jgi:hypothetical protein
VKELHSSFLVKLPVPNERVGTIIGRGGVTIKGIQERSKATIQTPSHLWWHGGSRKIGNAAGGTWNVRAGGLRHDSLRGPTRHSMNPYAQAMNPYTMQQQASMYGMQQATGTQTQHHTTADFGCSRNRSPHRPFTLLQRLLAAYGLRWRSSSAALLRRKVSTPRDPSS